MSELEFKRHRSAVAVLGAWLLCASAWAQTAAQGVPLPTIRGFSVAGANPLADSDVTVSLAPLLRQPATLENLQKASAVLEALLRDKGFELHRVVLPPQEVGEVIQLQMVKFAIGQVSVDGAQAFSEDNIRHSLPELAPGRTPSLETLAIQSAMANENPSKNVQVALRAAPEPDLIDAAVKVTDSLPLRLSTMVNNAGSQQTGPDRFTLSVGHDNVMGLDHQILAAVTTSLANPSGVRQVGLNYRVPLYHSLTMLDVQFTHSTVVGDFGSFSSTGAGRSMGLTATRHLSAKPGIKQYAFVSLEDKTFEPTALNGVLLPGQQTRRSRPLSLGYAIKAQMPDRMWGTSVSLAVNLPGGSGNNLLAYRSESPAVTRNRWSAVRANGFWSQAVGGGWIFSVRGQAQWSSTALIAGEQIGIGGHTSLRGTQERAMAGDSGLAGTLEFTSPEWIPGLRWIAFWDAGWTSRQDITGGSVPSNDSVSTAGLGLRYERAGLSVALDYGRVIKGSAVPLTFSSVAPKSGHQKVHALLMARF